MKATDLPELRDELLAYLRRPSTPGEYLHMYHSSQWMGRSDFPDSYILSQFLPQERNAVRLAELFYVNPDMTELAIAAGATLPGFTLMREDLPAEAGLCVFDHPVWDYRVKAGAAMVGAKSHIIGFSWSVVTIEEAGRSVTGVYTCFYTWLPDDIAVATAEGRVDAQTASVARRTRPRLSQPQAWEDVDRRIGTALRASSYEAAVEAARADEREKVARRLVSWAGSLDGDGAAVALEAADVVRDCR